MSLLQRLKQGKFDALKAAVLLKEKNAICEYVILMTDEMYLQKKAVNSSDEYIGVGDSGNPFKQIVVFMMCGLKASIPIIYMYSILIYVYSISAHLRKAYKLTIVSTLSIYK